MIISRVKLANWKNFQQADVVLTDRVFVVGANASGKSNFLDVIRFLRDVVKQAGGLQSAVAQRGGVSAIKFAASGEGAAVSIEIHISARTESAVPLWKYCLAFESESSGVRITRESVYSCEAGKWVLERDATSKGEDAETLRFTYLEQPSSNRAFSDIYTFFREVEYLNIVPQLIREGDTYVLAVNKEDFYGKNLLDSMARVESETRDKFFRKISKVLVASIPQFQDIQFVNDSKGHPHLEAKYAHWQDGFARQRETSFSDGTLRLIGLMWVLMNGRETILIEEPELYLNAGLVKLLPEFIFMMQRSFDRVRQVIIATHSYDLLSHEGIGGGETLILIPTPDGTQIHKASDLADVSRYLAAGMTVAEAVSPKIVPGTVNQILEINDLD